MWVWVEVYRHRGEHDCCQVGIAPSSSQPPLRSQLSGWHHRCVPSHGASGCPACTNASSVSIAQRRGSDGPTGRSPFAAYHLPKPDIRSSSVHKQHPTRWRLTHTCFRTTVGCRTVLICVPIATSTWMCIPKIATSTSTASPPKPISLDIMLVPLPSRMANRACRASSRCSASSKNGGSMSYTLFF